MNGGPSIVGVRAAEAVAPEPEAATAHEDVFAWEEAPARRGPDARVILAWTTALLALAWVVALLWLGRAELARGDALTLAQFGAALLVPPAFAGIVWLLALRTSRAEAARFGDSARAMRAEAAMLERQVAGLGDALEARRAQLAAQARLLAQIGEAATARLAAIGRDLSGEIDQADVHARALAQAAEGAQARLDVLLAAMPRAQADTERLAAAIDTAAQHATERTATLDAAVVALAARGREAEAIAGGAAEKLAAYLQRMEATGQTAGQRLDAVTSQAAAAVDALLDRTAQAIDQSRQGIAAQGDAMLAMVGANQAALDQAARESAESLAERIAIIELVIERVAAKLDAQRGVGRALFDELETGAVSFDARLTAIHEGGAARTRDLAATVSALHGSADAMAVALDAGNATAARTIATTETLLTALDAATREMDETLPDALARLDAHVAATRAVIAGARPDLLALVAAAESTHEAIEGVAQVVAGQRTAAEDVAATLSDALAHGRAQAEAMNATVGEAAQRTHALSEEAAPRLLEALLRVRETAATAADHARDTLARVIPEAAEALERAGTAAMRRAADNGVHAQVAQIATVAEVAVEAATRAAERLGERIATIEGGVAEIDRRLEAARAEREEAERDHFARRASLLIESLNSASIDLTRTFAPEVSDSAWAAYLKGDRGVFTRRAVRLLDGTEQRDVARLYDADAGFREQVNRYIHDFEAMLRTILAQRDSSPLGVTLLSSDMGKLYVALAQAIERLR